MCQPPCHRGWASATSQETHGEDGNLPKGPKGGPKPRLRWLLSDHTWLAHHIRVAAWHVELLFGGGRGAVETPRPGPEKLGAVRQDPDLIGLLFRLI